MVQAHLDLEATWQHFLDSHFAAPRKLLRWGPEHRVYRIGDRVAKIEMIEIGERDQTRSIEYEFGLLRRLEGRACRFNPDYRVIDGRWCILEIDWIEGDYLDDLIAAGRGPEVSTARLLAILLRISMAGVIYRQLRARHVIQRPGGELAVIDFGQSRATNSLRALFTNLAPVSMSGGRISASRACSLIVEMRRRREPVTSDRAHAIASGQQRWAANQHRTAVGRPPHLAKNPGDARAADQFARMEIELEAAVAQNPGLAADVYEFHFAEYGLAGHRDWGFIWDHISSAVDFTDKVVVDFGCGTGTLDVFARLAGARSVLGVDDDANVLAAARHFTDGLQIGQVRFEHVENLVDPDLLAALPAGDILAALSVRTEDVPVHLMAEHIAAYREVLWQTPDLDGATAALHAIGFAQVERLVAGATGRDIIHARRNRTGTAST